MPIVLDTVSIYMLCMLQWLYNKLYKSTQAKKECEECLVTTIPTITQLFMAYLESTSTSNKGPLK